MADDTAYLDDFARCLEQGCHRMAQTAGYGGTRINESDDLDDRWLALAGDYLADAVPCVADYPVVSLAWAAFLGMAVATEWDGDWDARKDAPYSDYYGSQGFDDLDEHVLRDVLGLPLDGDEAKALNDLVRRCAQQAVDRIRHEQIPPQSSLAFHVFARACTVMYRIGASVQLSRLGYKMLMKE